MVRPGANGYPPHVVDRLAELTSLDDLVRIVADADGGRDLYIRWSRGPETDRGSVSRDGLTGVTLPALSASPLRVERWWGDRSPRLWVARRLHDYRHLRELRGPHVRPWVLRGTEVARGPDNEPLVEVQEPIAWVREDVLSEVDDVLAEHRPDWGTLDRSP